MKLKECLNIEIRELKKIYIFIRKQVRSVKFFFFFLIKNKKIY